MNKRDRAIESGYEVADFIADLCLAYVPVAMFIIQVMATTSIALDGALATNKGFTLIWAIATAICVDGLWLSTWLRVRSYKFEKRATWYEAVAMIARYTAMIVLALFMTCIAVGMAILITYQQVQSVPNEIVAMQSLLIQPIWFIIARGSLVIICATVAIFFRAEKQEQIATTRKNRVTRIRVVEATTSTEKVAIPEVASSHNEPLTVATSAKRATVVEALKVAYENSQDVNLKEIERATGISYSYIKRINKELSNTVQ